MISDFVNALENDYDVIDHEDHERNDRALGFVALNHPVTIEDQEFDGEVTVTVYADRLEDGGTDIYAQNGSFSESQEEMLDRVSTYRELISADEVAWTYYSGKTDDDIDSLLSELCEVHESIQ